MRKSSLFLIGTAAFLAVFSGCYDYTPPAAATLGETYSGRQHDTVDETFKDMKTLTLLDAQKIAIRNNPTYIAAYHAVEAARMKYYQSWGAYSPTVTASFSLQNERDWLTNQHTKTSDNTDHPHMDAFTTDFKIKANLLLFDGFARYFKLRASKSTLSYYERLEEDDCRKMMLTVAYAYNAVLLAIEKRRIAIEDRKFQLDSLRDTQYKFEAGAAPLSDVLNFEIQASNAEVNLVDADYSYDVAIFALSLLMGIPEGTLPADLQFPIYEKSDFVELPAVEIYLDAALANRPDLKAYRELLNIAKYQVYQAWSAYSPVFNGFVSYGFGTNSTIGAGYDGSHDRDYYNDMSFSYGITADWMLFNGLIRYNQLREAKANRAIAEFEMASQWFTVVSEVRTAYANYVQNVKKAKLYEKIRDLSARQRGLVDDEYRVGNAELTRLNEAQRDLVQAETELASSYVNIQDSKALLDNVVGGNSAQYYLNSTGKEEGVPGLAPLATAVAGLEDDTNLEGASTPATAPAQAKETKSEKAPAQAKETKPEKVPAQVKETKPETVSTPAPVKETKSEKAPAQAKETKPEKAPAQVKETKPETVSTPAPVKETKPETVSTPAPVKETKPETVSTPAPVKETKPETVSTPALVKETKPETVSTPAPVKETKPETVSTPAPVKETKPETVSTPAPVKETKPASDIPAQAPKIPDSPLALPGNQENSPAK